MKIVGFIPAKGSSTRVPEKNTQTILGVPLFLWAANNLNRVLPREDIYIDSDCDKIRSQAKALGFGTIERPAELATNATNGNEFTLWQASNVNADIYVQHLAPMTFLKEETLRKAIDLVKSGDYASAIAVREEQLYTWGKDKPNYDLLNLPNSFALPKTIIEGMGLYVVTKEALNAQKVRAASPCAQVAIDCFEAVDIDYPDDLAQARAIASGLPADSPYVEGIHRMRARANIKLLVLDVDGVMTDGGMYYSENGDQFKKFNAKDGIGIQRARAAGIETAFLSSGHTNHIIPARAKTLGVSRVHVGREEKLEVLAKWIEELGLEWKNVAYLGDDINDQKAMSKCGMSACPTDAVDAVKRAVDIVLTLRGGQACVRELIDNHLIGALDIE